MKTIVKFTLMLALLFSTTLTFAAVSTPVTPTPQRVTVSQGFNTFEVVGSTVMAVTTKENAQAALEVPVTCEVCVNILILSGCVSWCCANCPSQVN